MVAFAFECGRLSCKLLGAVSHAIIGRRDVLKVSRDMSRRRKDPCPNLFLDTIEDTCRMRVVWSD